MESVIRFFRIFSSHSSLWVILTAVVAFWLPDSFGWVRGNGRNSGDSYLCAPMRYFVRISLNIRNYRDRMVQKKGVWRNEGVETNGR